MVTRAAKESGSKKRIRTGVVLSTAELCAADVRLRGSAERAWRAPLVAPPADGASWPSLVAAFAELARTLGTTDGTLAISLMPPLTEVRRLELPPLRDDELHRLIARSASRYFVNARGGGPQVVGASAVGKRARGVPAPVIAAAASARLVASIRAAAAQSGWVVESIAPVESAWAASAVAMWPAFARQSAYAAIAHDDRTDLLQLEKGRLVGVRRFRAAAADAAMIADAVGAGARVGVAGVPHPRRELGAALAELRVATQSPAAEWASAADAGDLLAAHFAGSEVGPVLRAEDAVATARAEARTAAWWMSGAAAALLVLAGVVELWGAHHQLRLVEAERARLRPEIASTLIGRTTVDATSRNLATLDVIERTNPQWSSVITALSESVPDDAYFTAIRARQDSLVVDGLAEHAARVFDALEKSSVLVDVKAAAPVRRELRDDGTPLDHFTIAARVALPRRPTP
jgi:Tfp pilus assembly protein PilN